MKAEIISVGTELLLGQIVDTNAAFLARRLAELGVELYRRVTVGDNPERLKKALQEALQRADLVITIGGLGPTDDDLTREMAAEVMGLPLVLDQAAWKDIQTYFRKLNRPLTENNKKQAQIPQGGKALANRWGTAAGVWAEKDGKCVLCLPGPPKELEPMFEEEVLPLLAARAQGTITSTVLKIASLGESLVAEKISDLLREQTNPTIAPLVQDGEVILRLTSRARDREEAARLMAPLEEELHRRLGTAIYGRDGDTLASVVVELLASFGQTLATAESCTGGLLASRITDVPGASEVFGLGVVAYSNQAKEELLGVPKELLEKEGAVSSLVAEAMAKGIQKRASSHWGIGITGIAGPTGGTPQKPVGLVYLALARGKDCEVHKLHWPGSREAVRRRTVNFALDLLRQKLLRQEKNNQCRNN